MKRHFCVAKNFLLCAMTLSPIAATADLKAANAAKKEAGASIRKAGLYHTQPQPYKELQTEWKVTGWTTGYDSKMDGVEIDASYKAELDAIINKSFVFTNEKVLVGGADLCPEKQKFSKIKDPAFNIFNEAALKLDSRTSDYSNKKELSNIVAICRGKNKVKYNINKIIKAQKITFICEPESKLLPYLPDKLFILDDETMVGGLHPAGPSIWYCFKRTGAVAPK